MDSLHLSLVLFGVLGADDLAKESDGGFVKLTLLQIEVKMVFSQLLQDLRNVVVVVGQGLIVNEDLLHHPVKKPTQRQRLESLSKHCYKL